MAQEHSTISVPLSWVKVASEEQSQSSQVARVRNNIFVALAGGVDDLGRRRLHSTASKSAASSYDQNRRPKGLRLRA